MLLFLCNFKAISMYIMTAKQSGEFGLFFVRLLIKQRQLISLLSGPKIPLLHILVSSKSHAPGFVVTSFPVQYDAFLL